MRFNNVYIALIIFLLPVNCYSQNSIFSLGLWNITSLSGEMKVGGLYGIGTTNSYGINNKDWATNYYGGIYLKSSSYIWNPNFLALNIEGGYFPESRQDLYLIYQSHYDMINMEKLHISATLFPKKAISLNTYVNFDDSYDNREALTDIRTNSKSYGGTLTITNKFAPFSLAYNNTEWDTKEIQTNQNYHYNQENLEERMSKSFGINDRNDLTYTHHDFLTQEYGIDAVRNISDNVELIDNYFFDSAKFSHANSNITATNQVGADSFKMFRASESIFYKLPYHLTWNNNYSYYYLNQEQEQLSLNSFSSDLGHQLFQSLHSDLVYEYNNALETSYHEINDKIGINIVYTKKILYNGVLTLGYNYSWMHENRTSQDVLLYIENEQYTFSGSKVIMIKSPYIDSSSIVVKDVTGTIIYQNGFDYKLIRWGNYFEIQRIPGGQIADNTSVYLYYTATQPGSYQYDANLQNISANISLFNRLISIYFKETKTNYVNVKNTDALVLDYLTDDLYGARFEYKIATAGVEYDNYQSTITPYTMTRCFLNLQGNLKKNIVYSVFANWRQYEIPTEVEDRIYEDINVMLAYALSAKTKLDFTTGYQYQRGEAINLDLFTARCKVTTYFHGLFISGDIDMYDRVYLDNQRTSFIGATAQIVKKFKY